MARKAILIVRTLTLALVLILPWSLLHSWGHWLEYRSTLWPPEGLILYTGFSSEGFFPALETAKLSDLGALLHFSVNGAIRLYYAAGNIATWVYASALLFLSLFMKRLPKLRRGMTLAALAIGLLNLHYLTFTGFLYNPRATDWGHLWSLAPDSLITSFSRLVCILFPFLVLVYSTHLERTRENQDRQGAGHRDVVAAA